MIIKNNLHLREIKRFRVSEGRDLKKGLRLDRNEKVDSWPSDFINKVLSTKPSSFLSTYPEISDLYKKIAKFNSVKESQILITSGIDGGIQNIFSILTKPGDIVGLFSPTYLMYEVYSSIFRVTCNRISYSKDYKLNQEELESFFKTNAKILFVPNPNQPIESSLTLNELKTLAEKCRKNNCFLVLDEAYYLLGSETGISLLKNFDNIIILRTFSKAFGVPSIRTGYTISTEKNMEILSKARFAHESNSLSIAVAEYLLDNIDIVYDYCEKIKNSRSKTINELKNLGLNARGKHGLYVLVPFKDAETAKNIVEYLKKKLVYVKGPYQKPWDNCICITVGPLDAMKFFFEIMKESKANKIF